jgi:hypothetical protein
VRVTSSDTTFYQGSWRRSTRSEVDRGHTDSLVISYVYFLSLRMEEKAKNMSKCIRVRKIVSTSKTGAV